MMLDASFIHVFIKGFFKMITKAKYFTIIMPIGFTWFEKLKI
jgi:hypothetical protein